MQAIGPDGGGNRTRGPDALTHPGMDISPFLGGRMELDWLAGLIAGASSSVHCLAMCGGVAAALSVSGRPALGGAAVIGPGLSALAQASAARIAIYAALGAAAGAAGSGFHQWRPGPEAHLVLNWLGAAVLLAAAAWTVGVLPQPASLTRAASRFLAPAARLGRFGPAGFGLVWGLAPCPLVYLTTFYAGLTADALAGALVMIGFGLGTTPALMAAGLGSGALIALASRPAARFAAAAALSLLAVVSVL